MSLDQQIEEMKERIEDKREEYRDMSVENTFRSIPFVGYAVVGTLCAFCAAAALVNDNEQSAMLNAALGPVSLYFAGNEVSGISRREIELDITKSELRGLKRELKNLEREKYGPTLVERMRDYVRNVF